MDNLNSGQQTSARADVQTDLVPDLLGDHS